MLIIFQFLLLSSGIFMETELNLFSSLDLCVPLSAFFSFFLNCVCTGIHRHLVAIWIAALNSFFFSFYFLWFIIRNESPTLPNSNSLTRQRIKMFFNFTIPLVFLYAIYYEVSNYIWLPITMFRFRFNSIQVIDAFGWAQRAINFLNQACHTQHTWCFGQ